MKINARRVVTLVRNRSQQNADSAKAPKIRQSPNENREDGRCLTGNRPAQQSLTRPGGRPEKDLGMRPPRLLNNFWDLYKNSIHFPAALS